MPPAASATARPRTSDWTLYRRLFAEARPYRGPLSVLLGLSRLANERPDVVSVDCNPLIVVDGRPVAVDALVEIDGVS